jgi:hypothetical protein
MENIVFLEGIRGKEALLAIPASSTPSQINENTRVTKRKRLRAVIFPEPQHGGVFPFLRAMIDFSAYSHSGNGFV